MLVQPLDGMTGGHLEFYDPEAIGPKVIIAWVLILSLGWYTLDQTKRWFFATVLTLGLLFASARASGVITQQHLDNFVAATGGEMDTASQRARLIGERRHKTSAGKASKTNRHYRKHVEGKRVEREY